MELISVVVPCYNEQESLPLFYDEITRVAGEMSVKNELQFEFLFINDGSKDNTINILRELSDKDKCVRYVSFSRNFGKEAAMYAGLEQSEGDYIVVLDADLQHPPKYIPQMYEYVKSGEYDSAATRRVSRKGESKLLSFFARKFYKIINKISQTEIVDGARDFRFMTRQMVDSILSLKEYNRFSKGIFQWVGFETKWLEYENIERQKGETSWSFWELFKYSIEGIVSFTTTPLHIATIIGIFFSIIAFLSIIVIVIKTLLFGDPVEGWPSTISIILFLSGIQLFAAGIIGEYLAKIYLESKKRPLYIIKEKD